jgi:8-oxo-dGTP pyrophosphatase MutT (NUDIX family)
MLSNVIGGLVDDSDVHTDSSKLPLGTHRISALRETFEETGILLVEPLPSTLSLEELSSWRTTVGFNERLSKASIHDLILESKGS